MSLTSLSMWLHLTKHKCRNSLFVLTFSTPELTDLKLNEEFRGQKVSLEF